MSQLPENVEGVDFALVAYREENVWRMEEVPGDRVHDMDSLTAELRRWPGDFGSLGMVSVDEDFFVLVRVAGQTTRVLLSDVPPLPPILSSVYDLRPGDGVLDAVRLPQPDGEAAAVLRRIFDNGHAKLANTWREALIAVARAQGSTLTKNDARALIRSAADWSDDLTPLEAPLHRLAALPDAITTTTTALTSTT